MTESRVESPRRPIRSYVLRQGRFSPAQQRARELLLPRFGVAFAAAPLDFEVVFGRKAPTVLEIGFGMGESTAAIAEAMPDHDFLAVAKDNGATGDRFDVHFSTPFWSPGNPMCTPSTEVPGKCRFGGVLVTDNSGQNQMGDVTVGQ